MVKPRFTWISFMPSNRHWNHHRVVRISTGFAFLLYFGVLFVEVRRG
jgi:hypothetical protein